MIFSVENENYRRGQRFNRVRTDEDPYIDVRAMAIYGLNVVVCPSCVIVHTKAGWGYNFEPK